ncbi:MULTISPECIES: diguanylate cyclase [Ferrimonas]|uniref:sensor domain-containing diguanylate cyclase n=1 Tax=Ferrimonas TaxID=44011 RepID=UPI0003FD349A|nr:MULTISPECIES: diguanylate cyclase [Ferrimonas]USD38145.1 diguanylate cyclase [Ferrimonas sp. SCSIO 43195]
MTLKRLALLLSMVLVLVLVASYWLLRALVIIPMLEREVAALQWHETLTVQQWLTQQQMVVTELAASPGYRDWASLALAGQPAPLTFSRGEEVALLYQPDLSLAGFSAREPMVAEQFPLLAAGAPYVRARLMPAMLPETAMERTGLLRSGNQLYSFSASTVCAGQGQGCSKGYLLLLKPLPRAEMTQLFDRLGIRVEVRAATIDDQALPRLFEINGFEEPLPVRNLLLNDALSRGGWVITIEHAAMVNRGVEKREWIAFGLLLVLLPATNFLLWRVFVTPIEFGSAQLRQMEREQHYRKLPVKLYVKEFRHLLNAFNGLITRVEKQRQQLQDLSQTDALTGLANRRGLDYFCEREWRRLCRARYGGAVLMLDIDDFKAYNDEFGHQAGDECLMTVAREIKRMARRGEDIACRYGGEEFCIIYVEIQADTMEKLAESLRHHVEALNKSTAMIKRHLTASIGVALVDPGVDLGKQFNNFEQLIRIADQQLYLAKQQGKNRVKLWRMRAETPQDQQA